MNVMSGLIAHNRERPRRVAPQGRPQLLRVHVDQVQDAAARRPGPNESRQGRFEKIQVHYDRFADDKTIEKKDKTAGRNPSNSTSATRAARRTKSSFSTWARIKSPVISRRPRTVVLLLLRPPHLRPQPRLSHNHSRSITFLRSRVPHSGNLTRTRLPYFPPSVTIKLEPNFVRRPHESPQTRVYLSHFLSLVSFAAAKVSAQAPLDPTQMPARTFF